MYYFLALMTSVVIGIAALGWMHTWEAAIEQSRTAGGNITQAAEEQVEATLTTIVGLLDGLVERAEIDGVNGAAGARLQRYLSSRLEKHPALQGLYLFDQSGNYQIVSHGRRFPAKSNSDREYFIHHRTHADKDVYVGTPIVSRTFGDHIITLSRRVNDGEGKFAGVILATIPVRYFQRYYERFNIGKKGIIVLAFTDGTVVTRLPFSPDAPGSNLRESPVFRAIAGSTAQAGTVMMVTSLDGIERQHSYRRVSDFPFLVGASLAKDEILAEWRTATRRDAVILLVTLAAMNIIGLWLIAQLKHSLRLQSSLYLAQKVLEERNRTLDQMARTDALTGLYNRRHFDELIAKELARTRRMHSTVSLIMLDVDFFKRYNDEYGHAAGDDCLRAVASVLAGTAQRPGDIVTRFGGEEFAILLPETQAQGAVALAESIRAAVGKRMLEHRGNPAQFVTISAGVAASSGQSARALIEAADGALYAAKMAGRNCVCMSAVEEAAPNTRTGT